MINSDRERASHPSTEISFLTFVVKKAKKLKLKCHSRGHPLPQI